MSGFSSVSTAFLCFLTEEWIIYKEDNQYCIRTQYSIQNVSTAIYGSTDKLLLTYRKVSLLGQREYLCTFFLKQQINMKLEIKYDKQYVENHNYSFFKYKLHSRRRIFEHESTINYVYTFFFNHKYFNAFMKDCNASFL